MGLFRIFLSTYWKLPFNVAKDNSLINRRIKITLLWLGALAWPFAGIVLGRIVLASFTQPAPSWIRHLVFAAAILPTFLFLAFWYAGLKKPERENSTYTLSPDHSLPLVQHSAAVVTVMYQLLIWIRVGSFFCLFLIVATMLTRIFANVTMPLVAVAFVLQFFDAVVSYYYPQLALRTPANGTIGAIFDASLFSKSSVGGMGYRLGMIALFGFLAPILITKLMGVW